MSGSGKSALGRALAKKLNMDFMDTDFEISKRYGKSPEAIIENEGEDALRQAELAILERIQIKDNLLVATGGGFPIFNDIMNTLNKTGVTIYLSYTPELLWKRLQRSHKRPLIKTKRDLEKLLKERQEIYEQARIVYPGKFGFNANLQEMDQIITAFHEKK
jgi:shikimate kinase